MDFVRFARQTVSARLDGSGLYIAFQLESYVVMRVVVRQGFSRDMADMLLGDINNAIAELEKLEYPTPTRMAQDKNLPVETKMFNHGGRRHKTVKK